MQIWMRLKQEIKLVINFFSYEFIAPSSDDEKFTTCHEGRPKIYWPDANALINCDAQRKRW